MTDDDIKADGERNLLAYARNEKVINCLLGRFSGVASAFSALGEAATGKGLADAEALNAMTAVQGYDLCADIGRLRAALRERERLEPLLQQHGHDHMIRRR